MMRKILEIVEFTINLSFFFAVAILLLITSMELKFHFNLGNKISMLSLVISSGLRVGITIEEFVT